MRNKNLPQKGTKDCIDNSTEKFSTQRPQEETGWVSSRPQGVKTSVTAKPQEFVI